MTQLEKKGKKNLNASGYARHLKRDDTNKLDQHCFSRFFDGRPWTVKTMMHNTNVTTSLGAKWAHDHVISVNMILEFLTASIVFGHKEWHILLQAVMEFSISVWFLSSVINFL